MVLNVKWMIASDLHGSAYYARKLFSAYEKENADRLVLLGDLLYHGPRNSLPKEYDPQEVISLLNAYASRIICVRGNCDAEVDQMVLSFPIMSDYAILDYCGKTVFATHGHIYNQNCLPPICNIDILLYGHTHVPECVQLDACMYFNPGSVSIPKQNSPHSYMLLNNEQACWKSLDHQGFPAYHIKNLY